MVMVFAVRRDARFIYGYEQKTNEKTQFLFIAAIGTMHMMLSFVSFSKNNKEN